MVEQNFASCKVQQKRQPRVFCLISQVIVFFLPIIVQLLVHVSFTFHDVRDKLPLVLLLTHLGHCSIPSVSGVHAAMLAYDLPETWLPIFLSSSIQSEGSDHQTHHPYQLPHQTIRHSCWHFTWTSAAAWMKTILGALFGGRLSRILSAVRVNLRRDLSSPA